MDIVTLIFIQLSYNMTLTPVRVLESKSVPYYKLSLRVTLLAPRVNDFKRNNQPFLNIKKKIYHG